MSRRIIFAVVVAAAMAGCAPPPGRLTFPAQGRAVTASPQPRWFSVKRPHDFALTFTPDGRVDAVNYDDDGDGRIDRTYHLADYDEDRVPHFVILLDSIPYRLVKERWDAGQFRWFNPPVKVIPPFASLTTICFTEILHAPPLPGMVDQYYDRRTNHLRSGLWDRLTGPREPWQRYLHYNLSFMDEGLSYLKPRDWYPAELESAREAFDKSPDRTTIVYLTSSSGMLCRYGREGGEEVLDGLSRLCLQLLYERQGAVKISTMADHGHNLVYSRNIHLDGPLRAAGFNPTDHISADNDVVPEITGLVTYAGVSTRNPAKVTGVLLGITGVQHAYYLQGDEVVVRDRDGEARIAMKHGKLRYRPVTKDVLGYRPVMAKMKAAGTMDADGFASRDDWFKATIDDEYPDGPERVWDAFHGRVVNPPTVMFTTFDGYCCGLPAFEKYITMASTHGSLNQINSATFVMSMTDRVKGPMRSRDVMRTIVPDYRPELRQK